MGMMDIACVVFAVSVAIPGALCGVPHAQPSDDGNVCIQKQEDEFCFSYDRNNEEFGPFSWFKVRDTRKCFHGVNQSPIYVDTDKVRRSCGRTKLRYCPVGQVTGLFENDGYHPKLAGGDIGKAKLNGVPGFENVDFELNSIHVHIGKEGKRRGTEHVIGRKSYDAEMHIVHVREGSQGSGEKAGLAVIAIFLSTTEGEHNCEVDAMLNKVHRIQEYTGGPLCEGEPDSGCAHHASGDWECGGIRHAIRPELLLSSQVTSCGYYYYYGSLTTPTLSESVLWQLIKKPIRISRAQLKAIKNTHTHFPGVLMKEFGNLRPLQNLNGRTIYANICGDEIDD
ncbi:putative carbonic anhydrase 1 [Haliotis rufescens]|uniref:putative carbonic anhydrase 1 n=1 Tax=Haliotis rufescens TaxID=6454 RepID=UPI00201EACEC|nr:putative carbonic anhydrase 1 [Haliotis rufescens]